MLDGNGANNPLAGLMSKGRRRRQVGNLLTRLTPALRKEYRMLTDDERQK